MSFESRIKIGRKPVIVVETEKPIPDDEKLGILDMITSEEVAGMDVMIEWNKEVGG